MLRSAGSSDRQTDNAELRPDFAELEGRLKAKFAAAINKMALSQIAVAGVLVAALKLF